MSKRLIYLVCLGLLLGLVGSVQTANAAVAISVAGYDDHVWDTVLGTSDTMAFSWTGGSADCLVVTVAGEQNPASETISSVTFGSQTMTAIPVNTTYGNSFAQIFYLTELASSDDTITVTWNVDVSDASVHIGAIALYDVNQVTPLLYSATNGTSGSLTEIRCTPEPFVTVDGGMMVDSVYVNGDADNFRNVSLNDPVAGTGVVTILNHGLNSGCAVGAAYKSIPTGQGGVLSGMRWKWDVADRCSLMTASFAPGVSVEIGPNQAGNLYPTNNATGVNPVCPSVVLLWTPGDYADQHDVYFGTNFADVNDANENDSMGASEIYRARQDANSYAVPETLDFGQTYYWRIDEVNVAGPAPYMWKGNVWQFTTEPIGYPITNVTAMADSNYSEAGGPEKTLDLGRRPAFDGDT